MLRGRLQKEMQKKEIFRKYKTRIFFRKEKFWESTFFCLLPLTKTHHDFYTDIKCDKAVRRDIPILHFSTHCNFLLFFSSPFHFLGWKEKAIHVGYFSERRLQIQRELLDWRKSLKRKAGQYRNRKITRAKKK